MNTLEQIRDKVYSEFRGGQRVTSDQLRNWYKLGRIGKEKPALSRAAALGAWLAGRDDAKDNIDWERS